jgi:hypothetical protein
LEESQNKNWDGCPLFFIRGKDQDIERLKRGGCYEREKQRGKGKQEGATEKPKREEKDEEGEEEQVGIRKGDGAIFWNRKFKVNYPAAELKSLGSKLHFTFCIFLERTGVMHKKVGTIK